MAEVMVINPRRRRRGGRRRKSTHRRARATRRRRVRAFAINPRRRRRSGRRRAHRRHRRHVSRNPRLGSLFGVNVGTAVGTGVGIIGANLATAAVLNNVPGIPDALKSGPGRIAAKAGIGIAAGLAVKKLLKQQSLGNGIMAGGVIAALLDIYALYVQPSLPATLKDYEYGGMGVYALSGVGDDEDASQYLSGGENIYGDSIY